MKTVVLVKQVPDTAQLSPTVDGLKLSAPGGLRIVNPWDEHAIEAAIQLKEVHGGSTTALCVGSLEASEALKTALAMGVDEAVRLSDPALDNPDSLTTARILAAAVRKIGAVDLILAGRSSIDANHAATAVQTAALLDLPHVSYIAALNVTPNTRSFTATRLLEQGRETVTCRLPAAISVVKELNEPRYPTFIGIRKAAGAVIPEWSLADLDVDPTSVGDSSTRLIESNLNIPSASKAELEIIEGSPEEAARLLVDRLVDEGVV